MTFIRDWLSSGGSAEKKETVKQAPIKIKESDVIPDSVHWPRYEEKAAAFVKLEIKASSKQDEQDFTLAYETFIKGVEIGKKTVNTNPASLLYWANEAKKLAAKAYDTDSEGHSNIPPFSGRKSYAFIVAVYDPFLADTINVRVTAWPAALQGKVDEKTDEKRPDYIKKSEKMKDARKKFEADEKNADIIKEAHEALAKKPVATESASAAASKPAPAAPEQTTPPEVENPSAFRPA